jgi:hypothetical protein
MIPNWDDYKGRIPPWRLRVLEAARQIGLPIVDVDAGLRSKGDPLQYFPVRGQWGHFNPRGYALMVDQIIGAFRRGAPQLGSTPARRYRTRPGELT